MSGVGVALGIAFAAFVVLAIVTQRRLGPQTLDEATLEVARPVLLRTREDPGEGWSKLGSKTTARGLDLRFDADDDPEASAEIRLEDAAGGARYSNRVTARLSDTFTSHHVHSSGWIFRVSLRGTGKVVGREVRLLMRVTGKGAFGPAIENDDDHDPAIGDWIEIERLEVLQVRA